MKKNINLIIIIVSIVFLLFGVLLSFLLNNKSSKQENNENKNTNKEEKMTFASIDSNPTYGSAKVTFPVLGGLTATANEESMKVFTNESETKTVLAYKTETDFDLQNYMDIDLIQYNYLEEPKFEDLVIKENSIIKKISYVDAKKNYILIVYGTKLNEKEVVEIKYYFVNEKVSDDEIKTIINNIKIEQ